MCVVGVVGVVVCSGVVWCGGVCGEVRVWCGVVWCGGRGVVWCAVLCCHENTIHKSKHINKYIYCI